jgi:hypothetical protein
LKERREKKKEEEKNTLFLDIVTFSSSYETKDERIHFEKREKEKQKKRKFSIH